MEVKQLNDHLNNEKITLRKVSIEMAASIFNYIDEDRERLDRFLPWVQYIKTLEDEKKFIKSSDSDWEQGLEFNYCIFDNTDSTYVGNIGVHSISWKDDRAELGYWVLGKYEGKGYISEAVKTLELHLFTMGFNRVEIRCSDLNEKSARVPIRCGYTFEGISRKDVIEKGQYRDTKNFSKLQSEKDKL